jgi:hypothetical protein
LKILRSIMPDDRIGDNADLMLHNFNALRESIYRFDLKEDTNIYGQICEFAMSHGHLPSPNSLAGYFDSNNYLDEADRVRQISSSKSVLYRGDFISEIEREVEEARIIQLSTAINDAKTIVRQGLEVKEGRQKSTLRGTRDAGKYLSNKIANLLTPTFGARLGGEALQDEEDFWDEYQKARDATIEILPMTGMTTIDNALQGFRRKELYILAGYTGHMKSRTALNWVYNQAVYGKTSSLYFSLEMHYSQCRRAIVSFHTMHQKFRNMRIALGIQKAGQPDIGIDPSKIRGGKLSDDEELFVREVVKDLKKGVEEGLYGKILFEVFDPDSLDFTVEDLRTKGELLMQKDPFKMLVVDHALLMSSRSKYSSTTEKLNEVIRDLKKTASGFNKGQGVPILCLFQLSREGFKAAEKNGGNYNLTHLSYANEAERSADVVIAGWYGEDMREQGVIKYQCLKSRDQAPFENFEAQAIWPTGRLLNVAKTFSLGGGDGKSKDPLDDVLKDED